MNGRKVFLLGAVLGALMLCQPAALLMAKDTPDAREYCRMGLEALQMDNPYDAVDYFRSAIRLNPSYSDARLGMAQALFLLSEFTEAQKVLDEARKFAEGRRDFLLLEARLFTAMGNYEEARNRYLAVLSGRPHDADANRGLAEVFALTGQKNLAEDSFDLSLRQSPGDRRSLLQLVLLYDESREREKAEAALEEVLRLFPDNPDVRIRAAGHYALYSQWQRALEQLARARGMLSANDARRMKVELLEAELALEKGDASRAMETLLNLSRRGNFRDSLPFLYLLARAYRALGDEEKAQDTCSRILRIDPGDEIARMFREEALFLSASGWEKHRREAADWHLEQGRSQEENFYYNRAYNAYRRARLLAKHYPEAWMAYTGILKKMGYTEHYEDSLRTALLDIPPTHPDYALLQRRLSLLEHSSADRLGASWGVKDAWTVPRSAWKVGVYVYNQGHSLPVHGGSRNTLTLYFADVIDTNPELEVPAAGPEGYWGPGVIGVDSFSEAFRDSRGEDDYFLLLRFAETERTFSATCELYLSHSGELIERYTELRTGQGRVGNALHALAEAVGRSLPRSMSVLDMDGPRVLLDKGRWHGIESGSEWIVVRRGAGRPSLAEGGMEYPPEDFLGSLEIRDVTEPLSVGRFSRQGDFDFIQKGDEAFLLPVPENPPEPGMAPDPAFKARLLSIY